MSHPIQAILEVSTSTTPSSESSLIISASHNKLSSTTATTSTSSTPHTGLIRLLSSYLDPSTNKLFLISSGEDKLLIVSSLPDLTVLSKRELVKRANALAVTQDGTIVIGDKFGDVYTLVFLTFSPVPGASDHLSSGSHSYLNQQQNQQQLRNQQRNLSQS